MAMFVLIALIILLVLGSIGYVAERRPDTDGNRGGKDAALTLLPGDIKYESPSGNFRFYFPISTSIVLSLVLSLLLRFFG